MMRWLFGDPNDSVMNDVMASFVPQNDITILELAQIVNGIAFHNGPMRIGVKAWTSLPASLKRHFNAVMDASDSHAQMASKLLPSSPEGQGPEITIQQIEAMERGNK